ncbi:hypothetical protein NL380_27245, partial [Klebsiella pneumoniae]|nr:hypothetical protein [Klebsiella pneumoniae]
ITVAPLSWKNGKGETNFNLSLFLKDPAAATGEPQTLAQEVDRLNAVKKANEENAKVAAFVANLQAQNSNAKSSLDIDVQGAGLGDKERDRMKERLSIQR